MSSTTHIKRIIYKVDASGLNKAQKELSEASKATKKLEEQTEKYRKEVEQTGKKSSESFLTLKNVLAGISVAALIAQIRQIGQNIIRVTSEFQKLEAVLTTALGSKSQAQRALAEIKEFAATTPYAVTQVSQAFVKLANQGLVLTAKQMRNLGDLAASTGKDFDMLAEAIIDAQVGEFERLKEFGIRAQKQGDQVTFAFKGVETQVDFTTDAIQKYIIALGKAEGVSGSMEAVSKTLGGKISELGDAFDSFYAALGSQTSGVLVEFIDNLAKYINIASEAINPTNQFASEIKQAGEEFQKLDAQGQADAFYILAQSSAALSRRYNKFKDELAALEANLRKTDGATGMYITTSEKDVEVKREQVEALDKLLERNRNIFALYKEIQKQQKDKPDDDGSPGEDLIKKIEEMVPPAAKNIQSQVDDFIKLASGVFGEDITKAIDKAGEAAFNNLEKGIHAKAKEVEAYKDAEEEKTKILEEEAAKRKELEDQAFAAGMDIIANLLHSQIQARQVDWEDFNTRKNEELALAGDNADARAAIERRYAAEEDRLRKKQAEAEKKGVLQRILIENALAIAKAIAAAPPPINIPLIAIQAALGAAQYAIAASTPAYKDGVIDLQGPGTGTSDSISARLSKGESVMTARATARSREMLKDIQAGKLDDKTYKQLMAHDRPIVSFSSEEIVDAIKKNKPLDYPDFSRIGSIMYEHRSRGENLKQKIRKKFLNNILIYATLGSEMSFELCRIVIT